MRVRAGSMPPITSMTTSTPEATSPAASVVSRWAGHVDLAARVEAAYGDADQLDRRPHPGLEVGGLLGEQPHHLAADRAAAQQADAHGAARRARRGVLGHRVHCSRSSAGSAAVGRCGWSQHCPRPSAADGTDVGGQQVLDGLTAYDDAGRAAADRHHRRAQGVVVVAGHRPAVGAGAGHGQQVARGDVAGQELVLDQDVAGLAVLAHDAPEHDRGVGGARGQGGGVVGVVQRGADVVAHPAVDRDVGAHRAAVERDLLDGADLVERAHGGPDDRAARLDGQPRHRESAGTALLLDDRGQLGGEVLRVGGVVLERVGDAEAAAEVELGHLDAQLVADPALQREHPPGRDLEAGGVEDLRADVAVQPEQPEPVARRGPAAPRRGRPRR